MTKRIGHTRQRKSVDALWLENHTSEADFPPIFAWKLPAVPDPYPSPFRRRGTQGDNDEDDPLDPLR